MATKQRFQSLVSTIFEGFELYVITHDNGERSKKKYKGNLLEA